MLGRIKHLRSFVLTVGVLLTAALAQADDSQSVGKPKKTQSKSSPAIPEKAKAALEAAGLRVINGNLSLPDETELTKQLHEATKLKRALVKTEQGLHAKEKEVREIDEQEAELETGQANLKAVAANTPKMPNRSSRQFQQQLAAQKNQAKLNIESLKDQRKKAVEEIKTLQVDVNEAREGFVDQVLSARSAADSIAANWDRIAESTAAQDAAQAASEATGKKLLLKPSLAFKSAEAQLKTLEKSLIHETIPLKNEGSGLELSVLINGKRHRSMVVDETATLVSLPYAMAKDLGIEPSADKKKAKVDLGGGREVSGTHVVLESVRVGKFTAENVECMVLDSKHGDSPAVLGMSFLGKFRFTVNKDKPELRLVKVETGDHSSLKSKSNHAKSAPQESDGD